MRADVEVTRMTEDHNIQADTTPIQILEHQIRALASMISSHGDFDDLRYHATLLEYIRAYYDIVVGK